MESGIGHRPADTANVLWAEIYQRKQDMAREADQGICHLQENCRMSSDSDQAAMKWRPKELLRRGCHDEACFRHCCWASSAD